MSELVFLLSAELDIQSAYNFYETSQAGRGIIFMQHLDAAFGQLRIFSGSGPLAHGDYRRLLVPSFPYGIFYSVESRGVIVAAVIDLRQDPEDIRRRLG